MVAALLCDSQCCSPVAAPTFSRAFGLGSANFFTGHTQGASCLFDKMRWDFWEAYGSFKSFLTYQDYFVLQVPTVLAFHPQLFPDVGGHLPPPAPGAATAAFPPGPRLARWSASCFAPALDHRASATYLASVFIAYGMYTPGITRVLMFHPNRITQILGTLQRKVESLKNQRYRGKFMLCVTKFKIGSCLETLGQGPKKSSGFFLNHFGVYPVALKNPFHEQVLQ